MAFRSRRKKERWRWRRRLLLILALPPLLVIAAAALWLRSSLPQMSGRIALPGLAAEVTITRDAAGVPHIAAASETDAAFVCSLQAGHDVKECRFAGAVRADDADEFAFLNVEADGVYGGNPTEAARKILDLEDRCHLTASRAGLAAGTG